MSGTGWFTEDPTELEQRYDEECFAQLEDCFSLFRFNCSWKTANFSAGDVLIFTTRFD